MLSPGTWLRPSQGLDNAFVLTSFAILRPRVSLHSLRCRFSSTLEAIAARNRHFPTALPAFNMRWADGTRRRRAADCGAMTARYSGRCFPLASGTLCTRVLPVRVLATRTMRAVRPHLARRYFPNDRVREILGWNPLFCVSPHMPAKLLYQSPFRGRRASCMNHVSLRPPSFSIDHEATIT